MAYLDGKVALVTGSSSGIGAAIATAVRCRHGPRRGPSGHLGPGPAGLAARRPRPPDQLGQRQLRRPRPPNARSDAAGPGLLEMAAHAHHLAQTDLPAGSMPAGILDAAARGDIEPAQCPMAIIDYLAPSLDTTISALGNAIWLFTTHPDQWQLLRHEPERVWVEVSVSVASNERTVARLRVVVSDLVDYTKDRIESKAA